MAPQPTTNRGSDGNFAKALEVISRVMEQGATEWRSNPS
jgi:hypothetical protein